MRGGFILKGLLCVGIVAALSACQKDDRVGTPASPAPIPEVPTATGNPSPLGPEVNPPTQAAAPETTTPTAIVAPNEEPVIPPAVKPAPAIPVSPRAPIAAEPPPLPESKKPVVAKLPMEWVVLGSLEVAKYPEKRVQMEVGVIGTDHGKGMKCELAMTDPRIRTDAKWSPLPIVLFNPADKKKGLSPLFTETLDFPKDQHTVTSEELTFIVEFTRAKLFRALWQAQTRLYTKDKKPYCTVQLNICLYPQWKDGKYVCTEKWRELRQLITHINTAQHIRYYYSAEREKDDIVKLELRLRDLDAKGYPAGDVYSEDYTDFL